MISVRIDEEIGQLRALEEKDPETYSHMVRVSEYSRLIVVQYGLPEPEAELITAAAKYHDIGKIVVERDLLDNNLILSEEQREEIRERHVSVGETILKTFFPNSEIPKIVRHHHEYYNGRGYPDGLAGEDIPLGSRIIAVADSYDAMLMRPYNQIQGNEAHFRLKAEKGKQFDPKLVGIVLELMDTTEWQSIK